MHFDYAAIEPASEAEFDSCRIPQAILDRDYLRADALDMARIERFLDIGEGTLAHRGPYYLKIDDCRTCGQQLRVSDFVLTAMLDASHSKAFVAQVLLGHKKIVQKPRKVRCTCCGTLSHDQGQYWMNDYVCTDNA